ncbi:hypothetical protein NDK50_28475 [Paraburkholderia bryophila]|uniref:hypothetical protein n=1 Tax=Paraburkholderia bryophila TaxID=420952 RepID=UPI00234A12F3|nr:hypothetical protein [Paraburkholderia bryophila]WCM24726.1 hypothetical protein NDK50_28475 [Paraburkholderia bryophila]
MYHDTDLPNLPVSPLDEPAPAGKAYGRPAPAVAPPRFGRLAMGVATAGALALGVMGTVAYGVWFNHDQQAYAEAIAGARQALGASAPAAGGGAPGTLTANAARANSATQNAANAAAAVPSARNPATVVPTAGGTSSEAQAEQGGRLASWSGEVARPATSDPQLAGATDVAPGASPSSSSSAAGRRATVAAAPPTLQLTAARPARDPRSTDARAASPSERHAANTRPKSLFARMGQFFHRVSYRQHGNASQQDIYSHP